MERRDVKASIEQWKVIVEFFEEHPILIKSKFRNFDGDSEECGKLWDQLTIKLNSMGLGARSREKWQMAIGRWKSKTKSKASNIRMEMEKTGGGPVKAPPLNPIEERLMALLGCKCVTGDRNVELGLTPRAPIVPVTEIHETEVDSFTSLPSTSKAQISPILVVKPTALGKKNEDHTAADNIPPPLITLKRSASAANLPASGTSSTKRKVTSKLTSDKTKRFVTLSRMHSETMQTLNLIDKNTNVIATALQSIRSDIHRYVNHVTMNE